MRLDFDVCIMDRIAVNRSKNEMESWNIFAKFGYTQKIQYVFN